MTSRDAVSGCSAILGIVLGGAGCWRADLYPLTRGSANDGSSDAAGTGGGTGWALYVAPDGDDSNPGTLAQPLRTLAKARDLVQTKNSAMTADIAVYLRGGTYPQTSTLTFANADSGSGGFYVKYMAYPGERPLITGGQPHQGLEAVRHDQQHLLDQRGHNRLPTALRQRRQSHPGAQPKPRGERCRQLQSAFRLRRDRAQRSALELVRRELEQSHQSRDALDDRLGGQYPASCVGHDFGQYRVREVPERRGCHSLRAAQPPARSEGWGAGRVFYFENALEMLDQPGEWYLDETTNIVYYKPRAGEDMATVTVIAPMVETILSVKGTSTSEQASYIWFQGLAFAHSTYMRPSQYGFLDGQAGQYNLTAQANNNQTVGRPAAGVSVVNANHIHFERNLFTQMAATGLDFISGTHDDMIIGNAFTDIGGSGISIGKFTASETTEYHVPYNPTDKDEICTRDTIKDNYIDNVTTEIQGACGIAAGYPAYIDIEHNEVTGTNFTGISVGYGWTTSTTAMTNNQINYNNIYHVANILAGGAGISTISNQGPASEMQYNYLHDFGQSQWADYSADGLYLDEGTTGYTVAHNLMVNTPGIVISLSAGADPVTDNGANPSGAQETMASAGIEPSYADIKNLTIPLATF